jgi:hypothetical protein
MTCTHVLGLLDAGPFADWPPAHLDAAREHARQCATCGPALRAATALPATLAALPQVSAPTDLAGAVMAGLHRIEDAARGTATDRPVVIAASVRAWPAWAAALGGLASGLAMAMRTYATLAEAARTAAGGAMAGLLSIPPPVWGVVLGAGLLVYAAGVFAPVAGRTRA